MIGVAAFELLLLAQRLPDSNTNLYRPTRAAQRLPGAP